jgi:hypothetical protein
MRYLNAGVKDFVLQTKCLRQTIYLGLNSTTSVYDLSSVVQEFLRIEYLNTTIEAKTQEELDVLDPDWKEAEGETIKYVTFSDLSRGIIRIYPKLTSDIPSVVTQNSLYGAIIDFTLNDDTYEIPNIADIEDNLSYYLVAYAVKKPSPVTLDTLDVDFELNSIYDDAIELYITYRALRSDTDAENRQFGSEQLQLYNNYVAESKLSGSSNNEDVSSRVINYRRPF